jgi:GNAT superfamily N-acetyltransferase
MVPSVEIQALPVARRAEARIVAARAFTNEPFMTGLAGDDPTDRLAVAIGYWCGQPWDEPVQLAALVGDTIVGVCLCSFGSRCSLCVRAALEPEPPADHEALMDWTFVRNAREVHAGQGAHDRLTLVAVDPVVRGAGVGTSLVAAGLSIMASEGAATVLLECEPKLEPLYRRGAFERVGTFLDPSSDSEAIVMRARIGEAHR